MKKKKASALFCAIVFLFCAFGFSGFSVGSARAEAATDNRLVKTYQSSSRIQNEPTVVCDVTDKATLEKLTAQDERLTLNSELTPKNVMFSRDYNPDVTTNYGLSPLVSAAKLTYIIDNGLKRQNTTIQQGGVSAIVTPKEDITHGGPTEIAKQNTEEDLNQRRDGRHISYMRSPIDVHLLGDTPVNLALLDSSDSAVSALCFVYGYPYALYKSETTYDNQAAAKKILIENIGIPYAEDFLEKYTKFCRFENGEHWIINTDKIENKKSSVDELIDLMGENIIEYK